MLFPARAGVIPKYGVKTVEAATLPRTRGGDPYKLQIRTKDAHSSPRTRG